MQTLMQEISQAKLKKWTRLSDPKFRWKEGIFLAEGVKVIEELSTADWEIEALGVLPDKARYWQDAAAKIAGHVPTYRLNRMQWEKVTQDREPEGILAIVKRKPEQNLLARFRQSNSHLLILDRVTNPNNMGALLRSANWFGFQYILMGSGCVDYAHPKVVRTSMGSIFHLMFMSDVDLSAILAVIRETHYLIGSDVRTGKRPHPVGRKTALLLGSESHGIGEGLLTQTDERWRIPGETQADSLSLPQAGSIMMYEAAKREVTGDM